MRSLAVRYSSRCVQPTLRNISGSRLHSAITSAEKEPSHRDSSSVIYLSFSCSQFFVQWESLRDGFYSRTDFIQFRFICVVLDSFTINSAILRASASFRPLVVMAGVPIRMPLALLAPSVSKGIVFLLTVISTVSNNFSTCFRSSHCL